jgi:hypothetical protein
MASGEAVTKQQSRPAHKPISSLLSKMRSAPPSFNTPEFWEWIRDDTARGKAIKEEKERIAEAEREARRAYYRTQLAEMEAKIQALKAEEVALILYMMNRTS